MKNIYKFYSYTKKYGLLTTLSKAKRYALKHAKTVKEPIDVMVDIDDVIRADYITKPYVAPAKKKRITLDIAWVLSPLSAGSGGQNTIVRFARYLQQAGHTVTFYIYEGIHPQSPAQAKKILKESFSFDVEVKKLAQFKDADALIATGWETAYPVFNVSSGAHKFYFIQDFEPLFYGLGSKSVLAQNTYRMNLFGITAGKWLSHKVRTEFGMQADHFDFGADLDIYKPKAADGYSKQKKIVFYARPVTERRAFELGVITLDLFHKKHPEYVIEFIGWDVSNFIIPFPYVNRGVLSHDDLAEVYHESVACLVLSLTNVSLLPLELLAAGCIPVMNDGDNNKMVLGENSNIRYAAASPIQLSEELSKAVDSKTIESNAKRASESVDSLSWDSSYERVESILMREVTGK